MPPAVLQLCRATIDGGYDYHADISRAYGDHGVRVCSVFLRNAFGADRIAAYAGAVRFLHAERRPLYKYPLFAAAALRGLPDAPFELAVCHHFAAARVGARLRDSGRGRVRRLAFVIHDYGYFAAADRHGRRRRRFVGRLEPHDRLVTVSQALRADVLAALPDLDPARCIAIPNAIDVATFSRQIVPAADARRALGLSADDFVIGSVGRLVPYKAQRDLLDAFAQTGRGMPDARLVLIGRGPEHDALQTRAHELGIAGRVTLAGFVPHAAHRIGAFDIFVLPSHREPFGLVLLEAMAQRLALVAADSGAAPEVVADAGLLYPTGDAAALARRLLQLYHDPALRARLADAGYRRLRQHFDIGGYRAAYRALLDGPV